MCDVISCWFLNVFTLYFLFVREYSCSLPYPHFAASAGADVTLLVTNSPVLFLWFWTPVFEQSSTMAVGLGRAYTSHHSKPGTKVQCQDAVIGLDTRADVNFDASSFDLLQFFHVEMFLPFVVYGKKMYKTLNFDPLYKFLLLHPPSSILLSLRNFVADVFHFYGLMGSVPR